MYGCLKDHPNSTVSWEILKTSNSIFSLSLPGASVLVPHFLAEAKRVVRTQRFADFSFSDEHCGLLLYFYSYQQVVVLPEK